MQIDLNEQNDTQQSTPRQVHVPFLSVPLGAGDAVKRVTQALGVKPCSPCQKRAEKMNQAVRFVPMGWA